MKQKNPKKDGSESILPDPLWCGPPIGFEAMDQRDLFAALRSAGGWSERQVTEGLNCFFTDDDFMSTHGFSVEDGRVADSQAVRKWLYEDVKPTDLYRLAFGQLLNAAGGHYGEAWRAAFGNVWMARDIKGLREKKKKAKVERDIAELQSLVRTDRRLTHLPSLFGAEQPLPLASAYVDLSVVEAAFISSSSTQLQRSTSLAERIEARIDRRYAAKKTPQELFDIGRGLAALIMGDPGAGKSSLLKRIALDVASGDWDSSKVPVFVEARMFWAKRQHDSTLSLLNCALQPLAASANLTEDALRELLFPRQQDAGPGILLVDGLDEIASSPDAVDLIYEELRTLSQQVRWIATCRPTGLVASPGDTTRCEMVELDEEAIEDLIVSWCQASSVHGSNIASDALLREIFESPSNREMASNPFLLTALCFLKSVTPNLNLPTTRIEVYSQLFDRIGSQARSDMRRSDILTDNVMSQLEAFCFHLYESKGAKQVFTRTDWTDFQSAIDSAPINLDRSVIPARVLTTFAAGISEFHFIHLSMQEFLVAKAMLDKGVEFALSKRLHPTWRPVFRFYGALLFAMGQKEDFKVLVESLYRDQDRSGFIKLTLAEIFSDVGIQNTKAWIGEDLKEEIYYNALSGHNLAPEALFDALVVWDPHLLERKAQASLAHRLELVSQKNENEKFSIDGKSVDSPYQLLARARTETACNTVRNAYWGKNAAEAEAATEGFALIATKRDRRAVIEKVLLDPEVEFFERYILLADILRRAEFVDGLIAIIRWCEDHDAEGKEEYRSARSALALIGGPRALEFFNDRLKATLSGSSLEKDDLEQDAHLLALVGGERAGKALLAARELTDDASVKLHLEISSLHAFPSDAVLLAELLADPDLHEDVVSALSWAADEAHVMDDVVCKILLRHVETFPDADVIEVSCIEEARLKAGQTPMFCDFLLQRAKQAYREIPNILNDEDRLQVYVDFQCAIDALEVAKWEPALEFLTKIIFDENAKQDCLQVALRAVGSMWNSEPEPDFMRRVMQIWFAAPEDYGDFAALCVGRIDLDMLFRFQTAHGAEQAIEQISAEKDLLVYDDFYADRSGVMHHWNEPPTGLLVLEAPGELDDAVNLGHDLSRYGICSMLEDHPRCEAAMLFPEPDDWCTSMLDAFKKAQHFPPKTTAPTDEQIAPRPVIIVPSDLDLQEPLVRADFAATIARQLGKGPLF